MSIGCDIIGSACIVSRVSHVVMQSSWNNVISVGVCQSVLWLFYKKTTIFSREKPCTSYIMPKLWVHQSRVYVSLAGPKYPHPVYLGKIAYELNLLRHF